jgi:hypothetical protein
MIERREESTALPQNRRAEHHAGDAESDDRGRVPAQSSSIEHDPRERRPDDGERYEQAHRGEQVGGDDRLRAHGEGTVVHGVTMIAPAPDGALGG